MQNLNSKQAANSSHQQSKKSISTWGVIRGFDNAVNQMNACFSNLLYELQKDELEAKEREERRERLAKEQVERRIALS